MDIVVFPEKKQKNIFGSMSLW